MFVRFFTDFYRMASAPATENGIIPFGLLKQGPKIGPGFRAISQVMNQIEGPDFFVTFSQNVHKIYARPEALMSIPNVLTQEPSRPPRGAICPAPARVLSSICVSLMIGPIRCIDIQQPHP